MKLITVLTALIVAVAALPHGEHGHNQPNNAAATPQPTTSSAAATQVAKQQGPNPSHGGHHSQGGANNGHQTAAPGNQGAVASPPPVAQATTTPAAAPKAQSTTAASSGQTPANGGTSNGKIDPSLVLDFGLQAGLNPDGTGNCKTLDGKNIPCACPPDRNQFIAKIQEFVAAGHAPNGTPTTFPTGSSNADQLTRVDTMLVTLQNFSGQAGKGCPAIAAPAFSQKQQALLKAGA